MVFEALAEFTQAILEHCSLTLQLTKTKVFTWSGLRPAEAPPSMPRAGLEVEGQWQPGFTCYGVEIGSQAYVRHRLSVRVEELVGQVDKVTHLLREDA